jgi:hypothetical protein
MSMYRCSDQEFLPNSMIHISLRHLNPPILENIYYLLSKTPREQTHVRGNCSEDAINR